MKTNPDQCLYCRGPLPEYEGSGRPRVYCSETCSKDSTRERAHLRRIIARLEETTLEQSGQFVHPARAAEPKLIAARQRLRDLIES